MNEKSPVSSNIPEVKQTQQWIEDFIIGNSICPPLVHLSREYRGSDNRLDWEHFSKVVDIKSYRNLAYNNPLLPQRTSSDFFTFIQKTIQGTAPLSMVMILPDFQRNQEYDEHMRHMLRGTLAKFRASFGVPLAKTLIQRAEEIGTTSAENAATMRTMLRGKDQEKDMVFSQLIEGMYNPVYFYGRAVQDADIAGMRGNRGPIERQKILSRAPYYLIQFVNPLYNRAEFSTLNRPRLYKRNTDFAARQNPIIFEEEMRKYRKK